jgi:hypothetical protein
VVVVVVGGAFFLVFFAVPGWPRTRVTGEKARKKRRRRKPAPSGNAVDFFMIADFSFCESIADIGGFVQGPIGWRGSACRWLDGTKIGGEMRQAAVLGYCSAHTVQVWQGYVSVP